MAHSDHFLQLYDPKGNLYCVMLSAELWGKYSHKLEPAIRRILDELEPTIKPEPIHEWDELKQYWDFKYPYCSDVSCGNCGNSTKDWTADPNKPFIFSGANIGGLAVFVCRQCGAIVRKKHFKDHMCFEFSTEGCGCGR